MLFLSIDFGTSAVKMSILTEDAVTICSAKESYPYVLLPGEKVEMKAKDLWKAAFNAADRLDPKYKSQVEFLCYDTYSPSPVFLDKCGNLVYPNIITHMDRRSREQSKYIDKFFGKGKYMNITGIYPFPGGCSAMTFLWFSKNEPQILKNSYRLGHLTSYIHKALTGEFMVDLVNASMMGMYDTVNMSGWSKELINAFGLEEDLFGEIYTPGKRLGSLLPEMADELGLKAGIPVAVGTNDVAAAQVGADNVKAGEIMNTTGSSEMVSILTDKAKVDPEYYLRSSAIPGLWQIYATTAGGFAVDWFYTQFCKEMSKEEFYEYVAKSILTCSKGNEVTFDPYLTGDRQSLRKKKAAVRGLTLNATRDQILYAMLKSMQGVLRGAITKAGKVVELSKVIKISGGMANDTYLSLKRLEIPGFDYQIVDDCPIKGNVKLVNRYLK